MRSISRSGSLGPPADYHEPCQTSSTRELALMSQDAFETSRLLRENISRVVLGKDELVQLLVVALLSGEHVLLEDVPGVGKTLAAKALAQSLHGSFARLQFTPDLLPTDITGSAIYRSDSEDFEFKKGPIFNHVVLADEINRAPPRTQSALLEAMSEGCVSIDGVTHTLPKPFVVVATQNPFEFEGTYALPESQMDRFLLRSSIGYPSRDVERQVMATHRLGEPVDDLQPVVSADQICRAQEATRNVRFDESLVDYLLEIVDGTRKHEAFQVGVSTRGALSYYRGCQAKAITEERDFVTPDDVKSLAVPCLAHRLLSDGMFQDVGQQAITQHLTELVESIPVPM